MQKEIVFANVSVTFDYSEEYYQWRKEVLKDSQSNISGVFVGDGQSFLSEFSPVWDEVLISVLQPEIQLYFGELVVPTVKITGHKEGSLTILFDINLDINLNMMISNFTEAYTIVRFFSQNKEKIIQCIEWVLETVLPKKLSERFRKILSTFLGPSTTIPLPQEIIVVKGFVTDFVKNFATNLKAAMAWMERYTVICPMGRKFNPMMVEKIIKGSRDKKFGFNMALIFLKNDFPWIYDMGIETQKILNESKSMEDKEMIIKDFRSVLESFYSKECPDNCCICQKLSCYLSDALYETIGQTANKKRGLFRWTKK